MLKISWMDSVTNKEAVKKIPKRKPLWKKNKMNGYYMKGC